jgi:hypothetical protein
MLRTVKFPPTGFALYAGYKRGGIPAAAYRPGRCQTLCRGTLSLSSGAQATIFKSQGVRRDQSTFRARRAQELRGKQQPVKPLHPTGGYVVFHCGTTT